MQSTTDISFSSLAEEFLERLRRDPATSIEAFAEDYPQYVDTIQSEFPALVMAEQLKSTILPTEAPEFDVPRQVGKYIMGRKLGEGGMGVVYSARHPDLDCPVAIKFLPFTDARTRDSLPRFHLEAQSCAKMNHANIVPVFDHGATKDFAYLAMRCIQGVSLDQLVQQLSSGAGDDNRELTLDWSFIGTIGAQVASALQYAHENGIIHRDVKPANLILDTSGNTWVTDFGLAKLVQSKQHLSMTGDVVGTPRYMAPEQIRGACDCRSDIYSLGLTLYELASGRKIWETMSGSSLLTERASLELPPIKEVNPAVPGPLAQIIMTACQLRPEDRYATAKELGYVLNRFVHGNPVADRRRMTSAMRTKYFRKKYLAITGLALAGIAAVTSYGVVLWTKPENPYQDRESALHLLEDTDVRERFVHELPNLIREMVATDDPEIRQVVSGLATDAIESSDLGTEEKRDELKAQMADWLKPYEEGGMRGAEVAQQIQWVARSIDAYAAATKTLHADVETSRLVPKRKARIHQTLDRLKSAADRNDLSPVQADGVVELVRACDASRETNAEMRIDEEVLIEFETKLRRLLDGAGIPQNYAAVELGVRVAETRRVESSNPPSRRPTNTSPEKIRGAIQDAKKLSPADVKTMIQKSGLNSSQQDRIQAVIEKLRRAQRNSQ